MSHIIEGAEDVVLSSGEAGLFVGAAEQENAAAAERLRVIRLIREAMTVKRGPYPDRRRIQAILRLLTELETQ
jgi:hypothetical protein